jgi:hypothetical protein
MNLKVLRWLLQHRDVLMKVIEASKKFNRDGLYIDQWEVIDQIARLVIPVFEKEGVDAATVLGYDWTDDEENEVAAFALGAEVHAMGVDWKQLVDVILPILIAILKALSSE